LLYDQLDIGKYDDYIFDCDGVLFESNAIKTDAFKVALRNFDEASIDKFLKYHRANGGISRFEKLKHFCQNILNENNYEYLLKQLLDSYGTEVFDRLLEAKLVDDLHVLRTKTKQKPWLVVSGGHENELHQLFRQRGISEYFDGGIYGSPQNKKQIFSQLFSDKKISQRSVFFGDSEYDYFVAKEYQVDFIFVYGWSEMENWSSFCKKYGIRAINNLSDLLQIKV